MISSLENALKETWEKKEKFYEDTKHLSIMEIIEKIEGKNLNIENDKEKTIKRIMVWNGALHITDGIRFAALKGGSGSVKPQSSD